MTSRRPTHQQNPVAHGFPLEEHVGLQLDDLAARFQEPSGRDTRTHATGADRDQAAAATGVTVADARARYRRRVAHHRPRPNAPQPDRHRPAGPQHP